MKNKIGLMTLFYTGIASILGSGWLMSPSLIASDAGPAAILSWIIGAAIIAVVAVNFIEVCAFLPAKEGGFGHYISYTHNNFFSFICDWVFLLSWISLIPAEADATVSYFSSLIPHRFSIVNAHGGFSNIGLIAVSMICIIFFIINYVSFQLLMRWIKYLTVAKILVPVIVVIVFLAKIHHFNNLGIFEHSFIPYGTNSYLHPIVTRGVVFALIGFQTPVTFAAVANNPQKNIPRAIFYSVVFCTVIYILLQISYLVAIPSDTLTKVGGWKNLSYAAPFMDLAKINNMNFLVSLLSLIAFIAPFGSGLVFFASAVRIANGFDYYIPIIKSYGKHGPLKSMIFILLASLSILWLLPSWKMIVSVVCVSLTLLFAVICLSNGVLNQHAQKEKSVYGIPIKFSQMFSLLGFAFSSLMYVWGGWPLTWRGFAVILLGIPVYLFAHYKNKDFSKALRNFFIASWLLLYVFILTLISYLSYDKLLTFWQVQMMTFIIASIFFFANIRILRQKNLLLQKYLVYLKT